MHRDSIRMLQEIRLIRRQADAGAYDVAIAEIRATPRPSAPDWTLQQLDRRAAIA
jgi:hypothetical protein